MNPSTPPFAPAAAAAPASVKWLWAAVGALGVAVLALGGTLLAQAPREAASLAPAHTATAPRTPEAEIIDEKVTPAPAQFAQIAPETGAKPLAQPVPAPSRQEAPAPQRAPSHDAALQPVVQARPAAPVCTSCGQVESVRAFSQPAPATGVGMVAGGVLGGVLGNQIGKGSGRKAATVLGAVGGGYVGHQVEQRARSTTTYEMRVRMHDGSLRTFTRSQPVAEGTPVRATSNGFRVDTSGASPSAPPSAVRVVDSGY